MSNRISIERMTEKSPNDKICKDCGSSCKSITSDDKYLAKNKLKIFKPI